MTIADHSLAVALAFLLPAYAAWSLPRTARRLAAGEAISRIRDYAEIIVIQWGLVAALALLWSSQERVAASLGLVWPQGWKLGFSIGVIVAGAGLLAYQFYAVSKSPDAQRKVRAQLEAMPAALVIIPRSVAEARLFSAVALTAGICEEVLYRGFLLWYFDGLLGWWAAVAVVIAVFGTAHFYQGPGGMARAALAGAAALGLYLLTGSLVASMALHFAVDIVHGLMMRHVLNCGESPAAAS